MIKKFEVLKDVLSTLSLIADFIPKAKDGISKDEAMDFVSKLILIWTDNK